MAETTKKRTYTKKSTTAAQTEPAPAAQEAELKVEEKTFSESETKAMIAKAVAEALAEQKAAAETPVQTVVIPPQKEEKVHFLWQAEVAEDNQLTIGGANSGYAPIIGRYGEFIIPKSELSRVMNGQFREWLKRRWIVVVDGMTDEERDIYGVAYKEGELLDKMAFAKMVELEDKILEIYPKLCPAHREMVAKRYFEAYQDKNPHVQRDVVKALNDMSVELGSEDGDFDAILEAMNEADRKHKKK